MVIIHIYGDRATSLLFCDHQDAEYESCEIQISISKPIFTKKYIPKALWENYIHTLQEGSKILWQFFIFKDFSYAPTIL